MTDVYKSFIERMSPKGFEDVFQQQLDEVIAQAIAEHEAKKKSRVEVIETNDKNWFEQNLNGYLGEGWDIVTANIYQHQYGAIYSALIELHTPYQQEEENPFKPITDSNPKAFKP